jgi:hypothetical protein
MIWEGKEQLRAIEGKTSALPSITTEGNGTDAMRLF